MSRNEGEWKKWLDKNDPENVAIPDYHEKINSDKEIGPFI